MDLKGNLSTEHQQPGDAKRPADTQDRLQTPEDESSDRGTRPLIAANGEVRGSGAGAGGGNLREDYDDDQVAGGGDLTRSGVDEEKRQNHEAVHNGNRLSEAGAHDGVEDQIHKAVDNQSSVSPEDYPERQGGGR
jgi:hypothetical protein